LIGQEKYQLLYAKKYGVMAEKASHFISPFIIWN